MRTIRRLLLLAVLGIVGSAAFHYWSDTAWPRAAVKAGNAANNVGDRMVESALTAKIKSKMALDDRVNSRAINVDTSGSVVTLSGVVRSADERVRAVRLARETHGISRVIDRLRLASN